MPRLRAFGPAFAILLVSAGLPAQPARYQESVRSDRVVVDARIIDNLGIPVPGLTPRDLSLRVDGLPVPLESVEWVSSEARLPAAGEPSPPPAAAAPAEAGRLIVIFFQRDMEPGRITGQMRMLREARRFLRGLASEDRVAVLSFDSRLKLRQDFTDDTGKLWRAMARSLYGDDPPDPQPESEPSLARSLDFLAARRASLPEQALRITGQALSAIPGPKSMIFFGWGIGNFSPGFGLILDHNYGPAREALVNSRTAVFSLDVTSAGFHSLQGGLEAIAADTGGFYVKTHVLPRFAMDKLEHAISGYYLLSFRPPSLPRGEHEMSFRLAGRGGEVLARRSYRD